MTSNGTKSLYIEERKNRHFLKKISKLWLVCGPRTEKEWKPLPQLLLTFGTAKVQLSKVFYEKEKKITFLNNFLQNGDLNAD